jgi:hypothetical protein
MEGCAPMNTNDAASRRPFPVQLGRHLPTLTCLLVSLACAGGQKEDSKSAGELDDVAFIRPDPIVVLAEFVGPDAAIHDTTDDVYLVSNVNGDPAATDDNGFISKVSPKGEVLELKWIDGTSGKKALNAPKGMALNGDRLYVADIDRVRIFHRKTGAALGAIRIPGGFPSR